VNEWAGFCLVRNLSPDGFMGQVYTQFPEASVIFIQFGADRIHKGAVVWCKGGQVGVQFNQAIDVEELLSHLGSKIVEGRVNRAPRLAMTCEAELKRGDHLSSLALQDISQRGLKASTSSSVRVGDEVQVCLPDLEPRKAIVRWSKDGAIGLNFVRSLAFEELAHWVLQQQLGRDALRKQPSAGEFHSEFTRITPLRRLA
jgi:hypothetical protein